MNLHHVRGATASSHHFGPQARHQLKLWLLLTPFLAGASLLIGLPALITFALAFTRYDAISPPLWNGLQNFATIFQRDVFWIAVRNSLLFAATAAPLQAVSYTHLDVDKRQITTGSASPVHACSLRSACR